MTLAIAAFDFDGTVADGDAVLPFISHVVGRIAMVRSLAQLIPLVRLRDRDLLKERFIAGTLAGISEDKLHDVGEHFARHLQVHRVRPQMIERIDWHRERGHRLVMVSASLDLYLQPLGRMLGFDDVLCTTVQMQDGRATGKLEGGNIRGNAKARVLGDLTGDAPVDLWAYGNSSGDVPMLARADHAFWVTRSGEICPWSETRRKVIDLRVDRQRR